MDTWKFPESRQRKWIDYLTGKEKSSGGFVIGEQRVVDTSLRSSRDAHGNPRSADTFDAEAEGGGISGAGEIVERYGREEQRRGGHGGRGAQDKRMRRRGA